MWLNQIFIRIIYDTKFSFLARLSASAATTLLHDGILSLQTCLRISAPSLSSLIDNLMVVNVFSSLENTLTGSVIVTGNTASNCKGVYVFGNAERTQFESVIIAVFISGQLFCKNHLCFHNSNSPRTTLMGSVNVEYLLTACKISVHTVLPRKQGTSPLSSAIYVWWGPNRNFRSWLT